MQQQQQQVSNGSDPKQAPQQQSKQPQPQWMAYPAAAMVMPPRQMMSPQPYAALPHYVPYYSPAHKAYSPARGSNNSENKTVWIGDLHQWMDEQYLHSCFAQTGEVFSIKVIRNKHTGLSEGYGFVEFLSHAAAEKVIQGYPGVVMPNTEQPFHLNWATFSMGEKRSDNAPDLSIFVGDLAADVNDTLLLETFSKKYPSVKAAKVVFDANTGRSKGYGFVRFGEESERSQAMTEMNGTYCSSRPMRIGAATPRKSATYQQQGTKHREECSQKKRQPPATDKYVPSAQASQRRLLEHPIATQARETKSPRSLLRCACEIKSSRPSLRKTRCTNSKNLRRKHREECSQRRRQPPATDKHVRSSHQDPRNATMSSARASNRSARSNAASAQSDGDSTNTTVFVGGLDPSVTDDDLKTPFAECGEVVSIKIPVGKGCGFVQFAERKNAEDALQKLNGTVIGKQTSRSDFGSKHWNGGYYGGPLYDGYGYPMAASPNMYPAAYAPYPIYGGHQQQVS
ncbi:unnamed protein product [Rhodiola kirilowii]